jgi:non-heme chloroperoxidase
MRERPSRAILSLAHFGKVGPALQGKYRRAEGADTKATRKMCRFTTRDGAEIYYKDWGTGRAIVFCHGWPLSSDAFEDQMFFFAERGFRCIAHDRRGHGRSSQPWDGNDMDHYADDLAELLAQLDLSDVVLVGHSAGGGEVARYIGRYGTKRVAKAVLVGAVPPVLLKSARNPGGMPIEVFDQLRARVYADRSQLWKDLSGPFYGYNRQGADTQVDPSGAARHVHDAQGADKRLSA